MIQQSPTEERARAIEVLASVTARMAPAGEYVARDILNGNHGPDTERAIVAMIEFASQAAQPAEADGWVMVPSKIVAGLPHLPVGPSLSEEYWFGWANAMQAARNHIGQHAVYPAATPKAPTSTAGEVALPGWLTDEERARVAAHEGRATPPAPNDDLRAAE